jgi:hypothetical protein
MSLASRRDDAPRPADLRTLDRVSICWTQRGIPTTKHHAAPCPGDTVTVVRNATSASSLTGRTLVT